MKMMISGFGKLAAIWHSIQAYFWAITVLLFGYTVSAVAQSSTDPTAPLDILKAGRDKAKNSNMDTSTMKTTMETVAGLLAIGAGVIGIAFFIWGAIGLYNNVYKGEQARGSNMSYIMACVIGGLITVSVVFVGFITNIFVGS